MVYVTKEFLTWHKKKGQIDSTPERPFFHEGEIWYCKLGLNVGFEQDGKGEDFLRPVVIIRKFNKDVCLIVPLTTRIKTGPFYFTFFLKPDLLNNAILSQVRLIDAKRLSHCVGLLSDEDFIKLKEKLRNLIS